jgi:hypothetical protein
VQDVVARHVHMRHPMAGLGERGAGTPGRLGVANDEERAITGQAVHVSLLTQQMRDGHGHARVASARRWVVLATAPGARVSNRWRGTEPRALAR